MVRILNTTSSVWYKRTSFQLFLKPQCLICASLHGFDKLYCSRTFKNRSIGLLYDVKNHLCRLRRMLKQPFRQPPEICIILHIIRIKPNSLVGLLFILGLVRKWMTPFEQSNVHFFFFRSVFVRKFHVFRKPVYAILFSLLSRKQLGCCALHS